MVASWFAAGAVMCGLGVLLGAFGAHGLRDRVTPEMLAVFETGVRYHLVHGLALLAVAWATTRWPNTWIAASGWLFVAGIVVFSEVSITTRAIWMLSCLSGSRPVHSKSETHQYLAFVGLYVIMR